MKLVIGSALASLSALVAVSAVAVSQQAVPVMVGVPTQVGAADELLNRVFLSPKDAERGARLGLLPEGVRSILKVQKMLRHGEFEWDDIGIPSGKLVIRVDVDRQLLSVFRGGHEIGTAVILYGVDGKATPIGRFPIKAKIADYHSRTYDAPMPYTLWLTDDGVAVHGSSVRSGRATNGCVGVPIDFARHLFAVANVGDQVEIVSSRPLTTES